MTISLPFFIAEGDASNSDKLQANFEYLQDSLNNKAFTPASLADADAPNNSIYYSTTASKLVYKNAAGVVNNLY